MIMMMIIEMIMITSIVISYNSYNHNEYGDV